MTQPAFTEADVEQLTAMVRALIGWPISAGEADTIVTVVLQELAAAGRLLPASTTPARTAIEEALTASERQRWGDVPDRVAIAQWADEIHRRLIAAGHIAEEPA